MKSEQKLLILAGIGIFILGAIFISTTGVPNTATSAFLFPLSILGLFFGVIFVIWGIGWIILDKRK